MKANIITKILSIIFVATCFSIQQSRAEPITPKIKLVKIASSAAAGITFTNVAFLNGADIVCYNENPVIYGENVYATDFIRMSNFWRCFYGGWLTNGQLNDCIYISDSETLNPTGPWSEPKFRLTQGPYVHINDPSVVLHNGTWYMIYSIAGTNSDDSLHYSTSTDGINWSPSVATNSTRLNISDPLGIAGAEITDVARPALVFAPDCVKIWFDGFLTNNLQSQFEVYLAEAPYSNMTCFTVKHKYGYTNGFPYFYEPEVELRKDGTYIAAYNYIFREVHYATSTDGVHFTTIGKAAVKGSDYDSIYPILDNPGFFYDQVNDVNYGIAFGMTQNTVCPTDNKIGIGFMQYTVQVKDPKGAWRDIKAFAPSADLLTTSKDETNFEAVRILHPVTGKILCEQKIKGLKAGDVYKIKEINKMKKETWKKFKKVKVAAVQLFSPAKKDEPDPVTSILKYIDRAGKDGVQLIVFPEYLLGNFKVPSPQTIAVAKAAKKNNIYVVVGGWERFENGEYSNTGWLFDRQGKIIGRHNKVHPAIGSDSPYCWPPNDPPGMEWNMKKGDDFNVFELDFGTIGIMTCYDGYFSEPADILSLKGAEIVCWINGRAGPIEEFVVKTDIFRNYIAMIATNLGPGSGTMIGTWPATILAIVRETGDHYITAEIDLEALRIQRKHSRVFHQREPGKYGIITKKMNPQDKYKGWREDTNPK